MMDKNQPHQSYTPQQGEGGTPTRPIPPPPYPQYPAGGYPYPPQQGYPPPPYPPYPYQYPQPSVPVKKGLPKWFWVLLSILGVFMVLAIAGIIYFGLWFGSTLGKPVEAVNKFYTSLAVGNCDEARSMLATSTRNVDYCTRWDELKAQGETSPGMLGGSISVRNGIATVSWLMQAGGRAHAPEIQLVEQNGQWKIIRSTPDLLPPPR